jgi:hypothetical protein
MGSWTTANTQQLEPDARVTAIQPEAIRSDESCGATVQTHRRSSLVLQMCVYPRVSHRTGDASVASIAAPSTQISTGSKTTKLTIAPETK